MKIKGDSVDYHIIFLKLVNLLCTAYIHIHDTSEEGGERKYKQRRGKEERESGKEGP